MPKKSIEAFKAKLGWENLHNWLTDPPILIFFAYVVVAFVILLKYGNFSFTTLLVAFFSTTTIIFFTSILFMKNVTSYENIRHDIQETNRILQEINKKIK
ncbi:MAG TPA: hypothetical protein ENH90_01950 [bacterium]|nr:hypothetical protein [bacterium]